MHLLHYTDTMEITTADCRIDRQVRESKTKCWKITVECHTPAAEWHNTESSWTVPEEITEGNWELCWLNESGDAMGAASPLHTRCHVLWEPLSLSSALGELSCGGAGEQQCGSATRHEVVLPNTSRSANTWIMCNRLWFILKQKVWRHLPLKLTDQYHNINISWLLYVWLTAGCWFLHVWLTADMFLCLIIFQ